MKPDIATQLRTEIDLVNRTLAAFNVDAGTKPAWTTVAGASFVAYGLRTGATQRIAEVQRLLPEPLRAAIGSAAAANAGPVA